MALFCAGLAAATAHAGILLKDSLYYPYTNGCIEGQGQWYCYSPTGSTNRDALVLNDLLILNTTNKDSVASPTNGIDGTNGFYNATNGTITFASFTINVNQLPTSTNGGYFCVFQDTSLNSVCHVFIDTVGVTVPGTYRLGVANFATSISVSGTMNYPQDLATNTTYTVVIAYDKDQYSPLVGANLWINPSPQDLTNAYNGVSGSVAFGNDTTANTNLLGVDIAQIGFSPYVDGGISNVLVGTSFFDVNTTNAPVIGIQPLSTTNYSGNSLELFTIASGADLTYQWFSNLGMLTDDGVNVIGSTTSTLTLNNLSGANNLNYYVVATDAYGNSVTSSNAVTTVITTPTAPFFPTNVVALNLTNNLFTSTGFTNTALGTGPLTYQWYYAPTNLPITYSALSGQTSPSLTLYLADYTSQGSYYVAAYNSINGGSVTYGPTNTITEIAPLAATISQLHTYEINTVASQGLAALKSSTVYINSNNVVVNGYVTTYGGFGKGYTEFQIQDATGSAAEVYLYGPNNTYTPPVGSYVTITGPVEIYYTELELAPASAAAIVVNTNVPPIVLPPVLENANFGLFVTNTFGTNALQTSMSLITFTNVYIYGTTNGGAIGNGGIFYSNSTTTLRFTVGGPYANTGTATANTNMMEIYQFGYSYPYTTNTPNNPFYGLTVPTHLYQLTGAFVGYNGTTAEIEPSRPADYVVSAPPTYSVTLTNSKKQVTLSWPVQTGSTYSVYSATNLAGPWKQTYGLTYYPTNGTFTDTNVAGLKFYKISSP